MKIALVTETFLPEVNGVAMTLGRLTRGLAKRNHQLEVVRPRQSPNEGEDPPELYREFLVSGMRLPQYPEAQVGSFAIFSLFHHWRSTKPDLIHIATEGPLGLAALVAAKLLKLPAVSSFHTNFHDYTKHYGVPLMENAVLWHLRYLHNETLCNMIPDPSLASTLESYGFKNSETLGRGVDCELFSPEKRSSTLRTHWGADENDIVLLQVSRAAKEKNIDFTIACFQELRKKHRNLKLVFVGGGPELKRLKKQYSPDVIFSGMRYDEDLASHYASADFFLFPSETETFGNVITEAMASALPVLTYDYAAGKQYIRHQENGLLAPFGKEDEFLKTAFHYIDYIESHPSQSPLGQNARKTAQSIPWSLILDQYESIIKRALSRYKSFDRTTNLAENHPLNI